MKIDNFVSEWRISVLRNAAWKCERCGKPASQAHHVVSRRIEALKYDARNGEALCVLCHMKHHDESPAAGNAAFRERRPTDWKYLQRMKSSIKMEYVE